VRDSTGGDGILGSTFGGGGAVDSRRPPTPDLVVSADESASRRG
jgi:hypothetical protein